jgi:hypothetical protein
MQATIKLASPYVNVHSYVDVPESLALLLVCFVVVLNSNFNFFLKTNIHLEDELRKMSNFKSQIDGVKKQLSDTQQLLSQETQRGTVAEMMLFLRHIKNGHLKTLHLQPLKRNLTAVLTEISSILLKKPIRDSKKKNLAL